MSQGWQPAMGKIFECIQQSRVVYQYKKDARRRNKEKDARAATIRLSMQREENERRQQPSAGKGSNCCVKIGLNDLVKLKTPPRE